MARLFVVVVVVVVTFVVVPIRLLAGQVVTIEPGVYVPINPRYPAEFHGIGIRIEARPLPCLNPGSVVVPAHHAAALCSGRSAH